MKILSMCLFGILLLISVGCTATSNGEKPKILCPACGTELDSIYHKHF